MCSMYFDHGINTPTDRAGQKILGGMIKFILKGHCIKMVLNGLSVRGLRAYFK